MNKYHTTPLPEWHPEVFKRSRDRTIITVEFFRAVGDFDRSQYPWSKTTSEKLAAYRGGPWQ